MRIITLINDWQLDSLYLSQIYGAFLSTAPDIRIVNITPKMSNFNISAASFVLKKSYAFYPSKTIHFNFIDDDFVYKNYLIAKSKGQYFVSPDNGFLSLVLGKKIEELYAFPKSKNTFAKLFDYLAILKMITEDKINEINKVESFKIKYFPQPVFNKDSIILHVIYVDSYGNLITNLTKKKFFEALGQRKFKIILRSKSSEILSISENYDSAESGDLFAVFNFNNLLEIGQKNSNISSLMSFKVSDSIRIEFFEKKETIF